MSSRPGREEETSQISKDQMLRLVQECTIEQMVSSDAIEELLLLAMLMRRITSNSWDRKTVLVMVYLTAS